jgi:hypothetical protein
MLQLQHGMTALARDERDLRFVPIFSGVGAAIVTTTRQQPTVARSLDAMLLDNPTPSNRPDANDVVYGTLLGMPYFATDPRGPQRGQAAPLDYVANAAGTRITHLAPDPTWQGSFAARAQYATYVNTATAVQSFNDQVLAGQYLDRGQLSTLQTELSNLATSHDWYTQVATEDIGIVDRQLLLFASQSYALQLQLVELQRQMLAAQVMANALTVLTHGDYEATLREKAQGQAPTPGPR